MQPEEARARRPRTLDVVRVAALGAALTAGCKIDLDTRPLSECEDSDFPACLAAPDHSDLAWIQSNIFTPNCGGESCHSEGRNGQPPDGRILLTAETSYTTLMGADGQGVMATFDTSRMLVVPGAPSRSYLYFLIRGIRGEFGEPPFEPPPSDVGFMPFRQDAPLCCQKLDAVRRWIEAGALP